MEREESLFFPHLLDANVRRSLLCLLKSYMDERFMSDAPLTLICSACGMRLPPPVHEENLVYFCPYCGHLREDVNLPLVSLRQRGVPSPGERIGRIGHYWLLSRVGKGGMGEVFLAYDSICGRRIALKRIREDLVATPQLQARFLQEARITSQLTHPAIIPIYAIHLSDPGAYYTMPYVEGESLKQILRTTRQQEKNQERVMHPIGGSIHALMRIFMTLCQAVAYAHSEGVLHRDLKPENVMVGRYGEVIILDWGLAKLLDTPEAKSVEESLPQSPEMGMGVTKMGKLVGTATYIAPECALGSPHSVQSEVYALGVVLYQLLTLRMPFGRKTIKDLRRTMAQGVFLDPAEVAPHRETPPILSQIASKCLAFLPAERYRDVSALLRDLEIFFEERSEWLQTTSLDPQRKEDWEFQEYVPIATHIELTRHGDEMDWVHCMISCSSFPGNSMLEAKVCLGERCAGIGFLFSVPERSERVHLTDGYCLWIGSIKQSETRLLLSTLEVMRAPDIGLAPGIWYDIRIELVNNNIHFSINNQLQFTYNSPLPRGGTHIGIMSRDFDFMLKDLLIHWGSQNLHVSCLAVPDAFLAHGYHTAALSEYRRIVYTFPGRSIGREALLQAGITLLEQGRAASDPLQKKVYYDLALEEFAKLHGTRGAPWEYLGKAMVYQVQEELEEEVKCFELALLRYPQHPLTYSIHDRLMHRLHESSRSNRRAAYHFALLIVQYLPSLSQLPNAKRLFASLQKHWEPLWFLEKKEELLQGPALMLPLAFWVAKPSALFAIATEAAAGEGNGMLQQQALFGLLVLGEHHLAQFAIEKLKETQKLSQDIEQVLKPLLMAGEEPVRELMALLETRPAEQGHFMTYVALECINRCLDRWDFGLADSLIDALLRRCCKEEDKEGEKWARALHLISASLQGKVDAVSEEMQRYDLDVLSDETGPLYWIYGCYLTMLGQHDLVLMHFSPQIEVPYPRSFGLLGKYLHETASEREKREKRAFLWENRTLYRQLMVFFLCKGEKERAAEYAKKAQMTYRDSDVQGG